VHEAAFLLRVSENEIRRRIERGDLTGTWAGAHRRVAVQGVRDRLRNDKLAMLALEHVLGEKLQVPRAPRPSQAPPPMSTIAREL
jgi:hypothetical protein